MMKLENVGVVIATRQLTLDETQKVQVLIGKPEPLPDREDWYCPQQIVGIRSGRVKYATGVDAAQALVLALTMVGAELYCSAEYEAGPLSWDCGAVKDDLGSPRPGEYSGHIARQSRRQWRRGQSQIGDMLPPFAIRSENF
jgi:hypothetical protein